MTDSMQPAEHISDVLIIGSGAAGLTLALKLADSDSSIHIDVLSKGPESEGSTSHAQGGIAAVRDTLKDNDSIESHVQDTLIAGAGLCDEAADDLRRLSPGADSLTLFHPIYGHFGERIPREEACSSLGIDPGKKTLLFFGLIREYKGLDILLRAFPNLDSSYQLVVAGEPYGSFDRYQEIIDSSGCADRIHLFTHYIKDSEVKTYFSATDLVVLPYRSATQSGINAIAYHFETPMVVTDTGGLRHSVGDAGTGLVASRPEPECLLEEIARYFSDPDLRERCKAAIKAEKERLSWKSFARQLAEYSIKL